jgi:hypothetical protein
MLSLCRPLPLLCRAIVPPVAVVVPPVALLPLAVVVPPVTLLPLAVVVPPVTLQPLAVVMPPIAVVVPPVPVLPLANAPPPQWLNVSFVAADRLAHLPTTLSLPNDATTVSCHAVVSCFHSQTLPSSTCWLIVGSFLTFFAVSQKKYMHYPLILIVVVGGGNLGEEHASNEALRQLKLRLLYLIALK